MVRIDSPEVQEFEKEHLATLRALAPECMVLLKKNGDFPLSSHCEIALYGAGARETIKGGTGSGDVNVRHYVTVEEGLENAGFTVTTKAWMDGYKAIRDDSIKGFYEGIAQEAKELGKSVFLVGMGRTPPEPRYALPLDGKGEVCVYVLARNSGEGADRPGGEGDYLLTEDEKRDILRCAEQYKKFLLVLNVGGPVDISPVLGKVENVLLLSQLGSVTGDAFADVLLDKASPSGKLTTTWARAEDLPSIGDFAQRDDTRYREGVFVGYRYYDAAPVLRLWPELHGIRDGLHRFCGGKRDRDRRGDDPQHRQLPRKRDGAAVCLRPGRQTEKAPAGAWRLCQDERTRSRRERDACAEASAGKHGQLERGKRLLAAGAG